MDILTSQIRAMTREQVRYFKMYMKGSRPDAARKDLALFDFIRKGHGKEREEVIVQRLYPGGDKNSFYRLKNRLLQDLACSLTVQHFDEDDLVYAYRLLALVRFHLTRNQVSLALYYLRKAEKAAHRIDQPELLDVVYGEYIKLSHEMVSINPETYIRLRTENRERLQQLRAMDDVLAVVSYRMKLTQNFSAGKNPVIRLLERTLAEFSSGREMQSSPAMRFRIYHAVSQVLLQKREYASLAGYLLNVYDDFAGDGLFNRSNHETKLQMLTYLVNALFKTGRFRESLSYADTLLKAMKEFQNLYYDKYIFFYYNSLVINYSRSDRDKAIAILEEMKQNRLITASPFYEMFVYLNLSVLFFDKQEYHRSIRYLNKLLLLDGYRNADRSLKFKIALAEMMIRFELKDSDVLDYKLKQLRKDYRQMLLRKENQREQDLLFIIEVLMKKGSLDQSREARLRAARILKVRPGDDASDSEVIQYRHWLEEKMRQSGHRNLAG
jgi:tetratricopeptide (TPR) repeat protein